MTIEAGSIKSGGRALVPESGLVIVAKSAGMTSHDVVARIRRLAGTKRVGHAGTLDPMATGVLVIGIEKATRLLGHLALTEKAYAATIRLGQSTVTDDADGEVLPHAGSAVRASDVPIEALRAAIVGLTGEIEQVPPKVSAIKVNGQRAYHLTRTGAAPELKARTVTVWRLELLAVRPAGDLLDVDVDVICSSGTYIRAIARDLGATLGTGGHLTALRRTRVGPYTIDEARTLDELAEHFDYVPLAKAAAEAFPAVRLDERETWLLSHGVRLAAPWRAAAGRDPVALGSEGTMAHSTDPNLAGRTPIAAFGPDGSLIALVAEENGELQPLAVFVP
ncbi:MAG TPA: tRNA pseudouridine(55) synthase TruB [Streptosporangiaceae bacterium]|nr:tRNA pseudouridine(55) synthase TruB [Streptosporangiaceae bacterium]